MGYLGLQNEWWNGDNRVRIYHRGLFGVVNPWAAAGAGAGSSFGAQCNDMITIKAESLRFAAIPFCWAPMSVVQLHGFR